MVLSLFEVRTYQVMRTSMWQAYRNDLRNVLYSVDKVQMRVEWMFLRPRCVGELTPRQIAVEPLVSASNCSVGLPLDRVSLKLVPLL